MDKESEMVVKPERFARAEQAIHEATDTAAEKGHAAINRAAKEIHGGASSAREGLQTVADRVEDTLGEARRRVDELSETNLGDVGTQLIALVKKHPASSLLISFAAGFVLASALRRN